MSKRTKTVQFRVTEEEQDHLRKAAADAGMTSSNYLRSLTLHPTVVVVNGMEIVLIPSTVTLVEADEELRARFRAILTELKRPSGEPHPPTPSAPADSVAAVPPAEASAAPVSVAAPASGDGAANPPSPDPSEQMVGKPSSPAAPQAPSQVPGAAPGKQAEPQVAVAATASCPGCGGTGGRHQPWCEAVTGEPPVSKAAAEGATATSEQQYIDARVGEGELRVVAEAEWRQRQASPDPTAGLATAAPAAAEAAKQACPVCGTMKLPEVSCPECGRRPEA